MLKTKLPNYQLSTWLITNYLDPNFWLVANGGWDVDGLWGRPVDVVRFCPWCSNLNEEMDAIATLNKELLTISRHLLLPLRLKIYYTYWATRGVPVAADAFLETAKMSK